MPHSAADIVSILGLTKTHDTQFIGANQAETALEKAYGGQLFAQALAAASLTTADDRLAHSVHGHFLAPGTPDGTCQYDVGLSRDGRSFSSRVVRGSQNGTDVLHLTASFHIQEPGLAHHQDMPFVPPPEDVPEVADVMQLSSTLPHEPWQREWSGLDVRYVVDNLTNQPARGVQQIWIRVRDRLPDDPALHRLALAYLSDHTLLTAALVPHGLMFGDSDLPRATLNHSMWFHSDARADEWILIDQRSPWTGGARGICFASMYTLDGRHVASLAQEGLIRPIRDLRRHYDFNG